VDGRDKPGHDGREMMPGLEFSAVLPLCSLALLLEELRGPPFRFPDLNIFDVGREKPLVPGGILHAAAAIAVELICRLHD